MELTLGLDLGTSKVAAVIIDAAGKLLAVSSAAHHAQSTLDNGGAEENVSMMMDTLKQCIAALPADLRREVSAIGVTGQMHSILLGDDHGRLSPLVTWQDRRCGEEMLQKFNRRSGLTLRDGFGGATLARLAQEGTLGQWSWCAAIGDYVTASLSGNTAIITDPTHAASWGLFDLQSGNWNTDAVNQLNIPRHLLPEIRPSGAVVGVLCAEWSHALGLPQGICVGNAIGDNQASILGTGTHFDTEIYLTLGTGAQLSLVVDHAPAKLDEAFELRPFPGGRLLLVKAPLCGGAAFAWLVKTVNRFRCDLGEEELPEEELFRKLDTLAVQSMSSEDNEIVILPHFLGERHAPSLRGRIDGLSLDNAGAGSIAAALASGIVHNLCSGLPAELRKSRRVVYGSGNAVRRLKCIQHAIEKELNLPLELSQAREEAAVGAALLAEKQKI